MIRKYLQGIYKDAMHRAYQTAYRAIVEAYVPGGRILECGSGRCMSLEHLRKIGPVADEDYVGIEWSQAFVDSANERGLNVLQGDLNKRLPFDDDTFDCIYGLSVLEHILMPASLLKECHRVLKPGGTLVFLTPNIATYFTALSILRGHMPSSGPHTDSNALNAGQTYNLIDVSIDTEGDTPTHRHLVVFSYKALKRLFNLLKFGETRLEAFGYYPFPKFLQPAMEKIDAAHCHQVVVIAKK